MLKKANIQWSGKTLCNQIEKGQVLFDCAVQRNPCWDLSRKSLLIHSMIEGYPIPPFYFARRSDKKYDALDGLQRSTAISEFIREEFALTDDTPSIMDEDGCPIEVVGKKMAELPEWAQDNIKDSAEVTDEQLEKIIGAMSSVKLFCDSLDMESKSDKRVLKKVKTRSHLVSSIYAAMRFSEAQRTQDEFGKSLYGFFDGSKTSTSEEYNKSVGGGSAKPEKIRMRISALESLLEEGKNGRKENQG